MQFLIDNAAKIHDELFMSDWFVGIRDLVMNTLNGISEFLFPLILVAFGVLVMLAGKKILPFLKFLLLFAIGFIGAYVYVAPFLSFISIDAWIVGVAVGALCGLLSRYLYILAVVGGCAFGGITLANMFVLNQEVITGILDAIPAGAGKYVAYAVVAGILMLFVFPLLKWVEMALTSFLGAYGIYFTAVGVFPVLKLAEYVELPVLTLDFLGDFYLPTVFAAADFIVVGALFLFGLIVQIVSRKKY